MKWKGQKKLISVIVACYNEQDNIKDMYDRVVKTFEKTNKYLFELIYVDNASLDNSQRIINELCKKDKRVKAIYMSRNFGSPQSSFLAGMEKCNGDAAILLHGDIQDPPELTIKFADLWQKGNDVVYGVRTRREGYNFLWNFYYHAFYWILNKVSYIEIPVDAGDFSLIDKRVINELLKLDEADYYVRCLRAYVGFKQIGVNYVRDPRIKGETHETIWSGLWWAKIFITNFSLKPLEYISKIGFLITFFAFLSGIVNIVFYFLGETVAPRGVPTIVVLILFLGGIQLLSISIIAQYLSRMFLEVKRRPKYIIDKMVNIK